MLSSRVTAYQTDIKMLVSSINEKHVLFQTVGFTFKDSVKESEST